MGTLRLLGEDNEVVIYDIAGMEWYKWRDDLCECNEYTLDILCLMALADAFGFEYGEFV